MTKQELVDSRAKLMLDAQGLLLAKEVTAETRSQAGKMLLDADTIELDIKALDKIETFQTEQRKATTPNRGTPGAIETSAADKTAAEKRAFSDYIRFGKVSNDLQENRELTTGGTAGQFIPQGFYPVLTEAMKSFGQVLSVIKQIDVDSGAPVKYAAVSDVANSVTVVGESTTDVSEEDPTSITGALISSDFLTTGVILVSLPELQDSAFNLDAWIKDAFGKRYYRGLSNMVTNGSSSGNIGSLKTSATVGHTTASPTAIAWSDIVQTYAALDPAYEADAVWSMNTTTRGLLLSVTDTLGRPLYVPAVTAETFDMILGHRVVINQFLDAPTAALFPLMYGQHESYLLRNVKPGLSITRLNERYLPSGNIGFIGFARAGGALLKSTMDPIISVQMHA